MEPFELMHRAIDVLRDAPGVRALRRRLYDHRFARYQNAQLFRGVFDSAEAAVASAPSNRPIGCDNLDSANLSVRFDLRPKPFDYPAFFWLGDAYRLGLRRVADLGGSVGMKYFAYEGLVGHPPDASWRVVEVPAMVATGRQFAGREGAKPALSFDDVLDRPEPIDVLYASGSLQYIAQPFAEQVAALGTRPARLVVNQTPIHAARSYFTLNAIGTAYCAYRVDARDDFVRSIEALGYVLRDEWKAPGKRLDLPFQDRDYSLDHYVGFCFDREDFRRGDFSPSARGS